MRSPVLRSCIPFLFVPHLLIEMLLYQIVLEAHEDLFVDVEAPLFLVEVEVEEVSRIGIGLPPGLFRMGSGVVGMGWGFREHVKDVF